MKKIGRGAEFYIIFCVILVFLLFFSSIAPMYAKMVNIIKEAEITKPDLSKDHGCSEECIVENGYCMKNESMACVSYCAGADCLFEELDKSGYVNIDLTLLGLTCKDVGCDMKCSEAYDINSPGTYRCGSIFGTDRCVKLSNDDYYYGATPDCQNITDKAICDYALCKWKWSVCGDNIVDPGETCDLGADNGIICNPFYGGKCNYCDDSCQIQYIQSTEYCGDGIIQPDYEECDDGILNDIACTLTYGTNCTYCEDCGFTEVTGKYCGDGTCDSEEGYLTCPVDCSAPAVQPSVQEQAPSGGGGGGGWNLPDTGVEKKINRTGAITPSSTIPAGGLINPDITEVLNNTTPNYFQVDLDYSRYFDTFTIIILAAMIWYIHKIYKEHIKEHIGFMKKKRK